MTAIPMHDHDDHEHHDDHRTETIQLWIKTGLLFGLGVYFAYNIASGNLTNYINARFAWLSYVAAALFLLIALFSAIHLLRDHRTHEHADHDHDHEHDHATHASHAQHDHDHDHVHDQISWRSLAIIAVPLVLGTLIPSQPLGAQAISGSISTTSVSLGDTQTFNVAPEQRNVLDWVRAFNQNDASSFEGQPADVIGFVYVEPTYGQDQFMVARFAISCCVADATAIGIPVQWQQTPTLRQGEWLQIKGTFTVADFDGDRKPVLLADSVDEVAQPEHPYLYP